MPLERSSGSRAGEALAQMFSQRLPIRRAEVFRKLDRARQRRARIDRRLPTR
jgi:hypothetical protein